MAELLNNSTIWYHGTTTQHQLGLKPIKVNHSNKKGLDFGIGFYLTTNKEQAIRWAESKADKYNKFSKDDVYPMLIEYKINFNEILNKYKIRNFGMDITEDFLDFVYQNRIENGDLDNTYDLVFGSVTDGKSDKLEKNLKEFKEGKDVKLVANELVVRTKNLSYKENQLCICNQGVITHVTERRRYIC